MRNLSKKRRKKKGIVSAELLGLMFLEKIHRTLIILWFSKLVASDQHAWVGHVESWLPDLCAIYVSVIKTKVG